MLDELVLGGEVQESSKKNVLKAIAAQDLLQEVCVRTFNCITVTVGLLCWSIWSVINSCMALIRLLTCYQYGYVSVHYERLSFARTIKQPNKATSHCCGKAHLSAGCGFT